MGVNKEEKEQDLCLRGAINLIDAMELNPEDELIIMSVESKQDFTA